MENEAAYEMLFRWRRYDAALGAAVSAVPSVGEADGPAGAFRIDVSTTYVSPAIREIRAHACIADCPIYLFSARLWKQRAHSGLSRVRVRVCDSGV